MPAATNSTRRISRALPKSPLQAAPPLSIAPRGNRSLMPTVQRAPRIGAREGVRDYGKDQPDGFDLAGFRQERR